MASYQGSKLFPLGALNVESAIRYPTQLNCAYIFIYCTIFVCSYVCTLTSQFGDFTVVTVTLSVYCAIQSYLRFYYCCCCCWCANLFVVLMLIAVILTVVLFAMWQFVVPFSSREQWTVKRPTFCTYILLYMHIYINTVVKNTAKCVFLWLSAPSSASQAPDLNCFTRLWLQLFGSGDNFLAARCGVCGIYVIFSLCNWQCGTFCRVASTYICCIFMNTCDYIKNMYVCISFILKCKMWSILRSVNIRRQMALMREVDISFWFFICQNEKNRAK